MATPRQKWKGWVTIHAGDSGAVAGSPEYVFETPGDDTSFDIACKELMQLWELAGRPINMTPAYDPKAADLNSYPNVEAIK
jgi:hypothetical protein